MKPANNLLLLALRSADHAMVGPHLEQMELGRDAILFDAGDEVRYVYFPCDGTTISLVALMQDGAIAETATVGREGAIGGIVSKGFLPAFARAVVQIAGPAVRIDVGRLNAAKKASETLDDLFNRYADCLLAQVLQSVACNALHSIEQRAARWLLSMQDRIGEDELPLTQEFLAEMLGVQRTYVTRVASALQTDGLIRYRRGRITVADRARLHQASCECYDAVRAHFERVLAGVYPIEIET